MFDLCVCVFLVASHVKRLLHNVMSPSTTGENLERFKLLNCQVSLVTDPILFHNEHIFSYTKFNFGETHDIIIIKAI